MANTSNNGSKPHELISALTKFLVEPNNNIDPDTASLRLRRYLCVGSVGYTHITKAGTAITVDRPMYIDGVFYIVVTPDAIDALRAEAQADNDDWYSQLAQFIIKDMRIPPTNSGDAIVLAYTQGDDVTFTYQDSRQRKRKEFNENLGNVVKYTLVGAIIVLSGVWLLRNPSTATTIAKSVI